MTGATTRVISRSGDAVRNVRATQPTSRWVVDGASNIVGSTPKLTNGNPDPISDGATSTVTVAVGSPTTDIQTTWIHPRTAAYPSPS